MGLSIRRQTVVDKARRYAALRGSSMTDAIEEALDLQLVKQDEARERKKRDFIALVEQIQAEVAKMPILDDRPIDEILYDEHGLPK